MTASSRKDTLNLVLFFILSVIFSALFWIPDILITQGVSLPGVLAFLPNISIFVPFIVAIILIAINDGTKGLKKLFKKAWNWRFKKIWLLYIFLITLLLPLIAYIVNIFVSDSAFSLANSPQMIPLIAVIILFTGGPVEEFGWRGYALPILQRKFNALTSSLILGIVWSIWHLPLHFISTSVQYNIPIHEFFLVTVVASILYTWVYNGTGGSLSAVILYHWLGNVFSGAMFLYWTNMAGRWTFFGIQFVLVIIIVKIYGYKKLGNKKVTE
jgi:membrane protease YdiL (CAAX protease family)